MNSFICNKRFKTAVRQEQIAEAALAIAQIHGMRGLNVAAVAKEVGIGPSALYRHYGNKGEIVTAMLNLIQRRLDDHFQEVMELDLPAIEKLRSFLSRHINLIGSNNAIPRIVFSEEVIGGMPEKRQHLFQIIKNVLGNVATLVRSGQKDGQIRDDLEAEAIAVSYLGIIQPAAIIWHLSKGEFDLVKHSENAWQLFSDAIQTAPKK